MHIGLRVSYMNLFIKQVGNLTAWLAFPSWPELCMSEIKRVLISYKEV
jgi:hypothetical protein